MSIREAADLLLKSKGPIEIVAKDKSVLEGLEDVVAEASVAEEEEEEDTKD